MAGLDEASNSSINSKLSWVSCAPAELDALGQGPGVDLEGLLWGDDGLESPSEHSGRCDRFVFFRMLVVVSNRVRPYSMTCQNIFSVGA